MSFDVDDEGLGKVMVRSGTITCERVRFIESKVEDLTALGSKFDMYRVWGRSSIRTSRPKKNRARARRRLKLISV